MLLPKQLITTLRRRRTRIRLAEDADTQHGTLMLLEQGVAPSTLARFFGFEGEHFASLMISARTGRTTQVPAYRGDKRQVAPAPWEVRKNEYARRKRVKPSEGVVE